MDTFTPMINAADATWAAAQSAINALNQVNTEDTAAFSKALLTAQLKISIATTSEQKASAAIDKAYQAHGQVASK